MVILFKTLWPPCRCFRDSIRNVYHGFKFINALIFRAIILFVNQTVF
jgi:hypothetical protein